MFPALFTGLLLNFALNEILLTVIFVYSIVLGGIFVGVGITACNPSYQDTSSGAFVINTIASIVMMMICVIASIVPGVLVAINQGVFAPALTIASIPAPVIGLIILMIGMIRLTLMEAD